MKTKKQTSNTVSANVVLSNLKKEAAPIINKLKKVAVKSPESYDTLGTYVKALKELRKSGEAKLAEGIDPLKRAQSDIKLSIQKQQALFQPFFDKITEIESSSKEKMVAYLKGREGETKLLAEKFKAGKVSLKKFAASQADIDFKPSSTSIRETPSVVVVSVKKIPLKYMQPNEKLILEDLKTGKAVPGCKLEMKPVIVI